MGSSLKELLAGEDLLEGVDHYALVSGGHMMPLNQFSWVLRASSVPPWSETVSLPIRVQKQQKPQSK